MKNKMAKIEIELPDFKEELNVSITFRKDGGSEVKYTSPSSSWKASPEEETPPRPASGGNLMNNSF